MTFINNIGCKVNIESDLSSDKILFSETGGFILEVLPKNIDSIKSLFSNYDLEVFEIGSTVGESIQINGITDIPVSETKKAWTNGLREKL